MAQNATATAPSVTLAANGKAQLDVVVSKDCAPTTKQAAIDLATYLGKISGATFKVVTGDGQKGIAVGTVADFKGLPIGEMPVRDVADRERYILRSHAAGLYIIAATNMGVSHGVWDVLYRLGHRQFFPGANWEIIPRSPQLALAVSADEKPDYSNRRIWYGFGGWDYAAAPYARWNARNRMAAALQLATGHAYEGIISSNQAEFDAYPEFYGLVKGERVSTKFCISNPELRKFIADHAVRHFDANPQAQSISMEPSDGGGWCECDNCKKFANVTDRAITLANAVAEAVTAKYPDKYVGLYAYSQHSPPPTIDVHPHVIVSIATSFLRGFTPDQLFEAWGKKGIQLGLREYYSVNTWDRDLPGRARGGNTVYLKESLPKFHRFGARFLSAESSDNWGPNGLGYYLASRITWDVDEAKRADAIIDEFLTKSFGPAKEPMRQFYQLIDSSHKPVLTADMVGQMYRLLKAAREKTTDAAIRARINDLVLYTRYVELFRSYSQNRGEQRQAAFEATIRHAYRMRRTMMVHTKALYRDLPERDGSVKVPRSASWEKPGGPDDVVEPETAEATAGDTVGDELTAEGGPDGEEGEAEGGDGEGGEAKPAAPAKPKPAAKPGRKAPAPKAEAVPEIEEEDLALALKEGERPVMAAAVPKWNMWKSSIPYTEEEYTQFIEDGIKANPVMEFQPVDFGTDLVPTTPLKLPEVPMPEKFGLGMRNKKTLYTWIANAPTKVSVEVVGGLIAGYRYRGATRVSLVPGKADPAKAEPMKDIASDGKPYEAEFTAATAGLHALTLDDRAMKARLGWNNDVPITFVPNLNMSFGFGGATVYFYVPKGTKVVGGLARGSGEIFDNKGAKHHAFTNSSDFFSIAVPAGTDGAIWTAKLSGDVVLQTVPPSLALHPNHLLLPRSVVEKDK